MKDRADNRESGTTEPAVRARMSRKVVEIVRREAKVALPAAKRAASHGVQAFLKKFSEEYAKERRKR